jgi:putative membrane protein
MLRPWDPSPLIAITCALVLLLYALGLARGASTTAWRGAAFLAGVALFYGVTQTRFDYYSQYLFSAHRGQHMVLHHLAPFLVALSAPGAVFAAALGRTGGSRFKAYFPLLRRCYQSLQNPWLAGLLFVGLIGFWLIPAIHFDAMLSRRLYWIMNWSMALDGLLFWWLVFARHPEGPTPHLPFGARLLLLTLIIPPQMFIGATLALSEKPLFDIYDICGRAIPISAVEDQQIGGLLTWIPAVMMSMAGVLILLVRLIRQGSEAGPISKQRREKRTGV